MAPLQGSKLAFIGGGNMAGAIIGGLVAQGVDKQLITVSEPWDVNRDKLAALGVRTTTSNAEAAAEADVVVVAVKPQVTRTVCRELADAWSAASRQTFPLVVSIAAGITMASLKEWITTTDGRSANVVRVMPNTPALVGEGAAGVYASEGTSEQDKQLVNSLLAGISKQTEWVEKDELIDVITGLSGTFCFPPNPRQSPLFTVEGWPPFSQTQTDLDQAPAPPTSSPSSSTSSPAPRPWA